MLGFVARRAHESFCSDCAPPLWTIYLSFVPARQHVSGASPAYRHRAQAQDSVYCSLIWGPGWRVSGRSVGGGWPGPQRPPVQYCVWDKVAFRESTFVTLLLPPTQAPFSRHCCQGEGTGQQRGGCSPLQYATLVIGTSREGGRQLPRRPGRCCKVRWGPQSVLEPTNFDQLLDPTRPAPPPLRNAIRARARRRQSPPLHAVRRHVVSCSTGSFSNQNEAEVITQAVISLVSRGGINAEDIGVISLYRSQVYLLTNAVENTVREAVGMSKKQAAQIKVWRAGA